MNAIIFPGTIVPYGGSPANFDQLKAKGWLLCDGQQYKKTDYPDLFASIGTCWGGDGADKFAVPDLRAQFLRGVCDAATSAGGAPLDPDTNSRESSRPDLPGTGHHGNAVGSKQKGEIQKHSHWIKQFDGSGGVDYRGTNFGGGASDTGDAGGSETRPMNAYVYYLISY